MKALKSKPTKIRINHVDKDIVTLGTFMPFDNDGEVEQLPIMIINDQEKLWFEIVKGNDVLNINGQAYQLDGYPIDEKTMLSPTMVFKIFGENPRENMPIPLDKVPIDIKSITAGRLLDDVQKFLRKYVGLYTLDMKTDDGMYDLLSHWLLYNHVYDVWDTCSYLKIMGDHDSGKSVLTRAIRNLSFSAFTAESKSSAAAFYRSINAVGGTCLFDEITLTRNDLIDFRDIIKSGIQRGASIPLVDKNDHTKIDRFKTYCPKVLSGTDMENLDAVMSSRMIQFVMQKNPPNSPVEGELIFSPAVEEEAREIRERMYMFRLVSAHELVRKKKKTEAVRRDKRRKKIKGFKDADLSNRFYDIYAPLFLISGFYTGKSVTKTLELAANDQMEMRRVEIYCQLDVPILRVLYQALFKLDDGGCVWLTDAQISNEIISIEVRNRLFYDKRTLSDKYSPEAVGVRIRGMGMSNQHRPSEFGLQWAYYKKNVMKIIAQKKLDFTWVIMSPDEHYQKIIIAMKELEKTYPLGSYASNIGEKVGFQCHTMLTIMEGKKIVACENGKWLLISTQSKIDEK